MVPPFLPDVPAAMYYDEIARLGGYVGRVVHAVGGATLLAELRDDRPNFIIIIAPMV